MHNPKNSLPNGWSLKKLGEIFAITSGTTPSRAINEYFENGTHLWVKTTDLNNHVISDTEEKVTDLAMKKTSLKKLPVGTVLVAMYGGYNQIGRTGLLQKEASVNQALSAILPNKDVAEPYFLLSWLNCKVEDWKNFAASSRKDPNITKNDVLGFPMLLPPLPEQQKIAAILGTWDAAIQTTTALLAALQKRKKALMQQLLSPKTDWKEVRLGECFERVTNGFNYDITLKEGLPVTRIETISAGQIDFNRVGYTDPFKKIAEYELKKGDILYSHINSLDHIGKVAYFNHEKKLYHGINLLLIRVNSLINSLFIFYWFNSEYGKKQSQSYAKKAVSQASINVSEVRQFIIHLPPLTEQTRIAAILNAADAELRQTEVYLEKLKTQKRGLMQQLLTGKVRVNQHNGL